MSKIYRIHFGFSQGKRYIQAVRLSKLAYLNETRGEGQDTWHIVSFADSQIDLMAKLYKLLVGEGFNKHAHWIQRPRISGVDVLSLWAYCHQEGHRDYKWDSPTKKERMRLVAEKLKSEMGKGFRDIALFLQEEYLHPIERDNSEAHKIIRQEGYVDFIDHRTGNLVKATREPKEYMSEYQGIRQFLSYNKHEEAIQLYYDDLGERFYGELHSELIYLKRLAGIPLVGRDLLYFRDDSTRDELISSNLAEYIDCIDEALLQLQKLGRKSPLEVLLEYAPTMEKMIEERDKEWNHAVHLASGEFKINSQTITLDDFSSQYDACPRGRLFDRYPDQVRRCRVLEYDQDPAYLGLWTTYSPSSYQVSILDKGLHLSSIEVYRHRLWKRRKREPQFTSVAAMSEIERFGCATHGIEYTGSSHRIDGKEFYEINVTRYGEPKYMGNPFLELVEEILREAENLLRAKHNIPKIGEGWVSEMMLFDLIKAVFPEAQHHATPEWLKPQHLDAFVPSRRLAFEYQGKQHLEPVAFFGGQGSFENRVKLDRLKARKCRTNGVILIQWLYTESIDRTTLIEKLGQVGIAIP